MFIVTEGLYYNAGLYLIYKVENNVERKLYLFGYTVGLDDLSFVWSISYMHNHSLIREYSKTSKIRTSIFWNAH